MQHSFDTMIGVQFIFLGVLCLLAAAESAYTNTQVLNANYKLSWNVNTTHIEFQTEVQASGWFGFGFSVDGSMFPGDVVIGYLNHHKVVFNDYHTYGHKTPILDNSQDWSLQSGVDMNNKLIFTFVRALVTGDADDQSILPGPTHVIWAYSDRTPTSPEAVGYHNVNRGSVDVYLVNKADIVGK